MRAQLLELLWLNFQSRFMGSDDKHIITMHSEILNYYMNLKIIKSPNLLKIIRLEFICMSSTTDNKIPYYCILHISKYINIFPYILSRHSQSS